jgi:hypothetical protein
VKLHSLKNMVRGWFVGAISPTVYHTEACELAIKKYKKYDYEQKHHHKIATEITIIISGKVKFNGVEYGPDDIITIEPNESTDFLVMEDTVTCCIKIPGALNDKYLDG